MRYNADESCDYVYGGYNMSNKKLGKGIRQRENGRYEARAMLGGQRIYVSGRNLAEVKKEFKEAKKEVERGNRYIGIAYTVDEWFNEWLVSYKSVQVKASSIVTIKSKYYRIFGKNIGSLKIKEVLSGDIQKCVKDYIETGKVIGELRSAYHNLSECFNCARANKLIKDNPCDLVTIPRVHSKPNWEDTSSLTEEEELTFLRAVEGDWYYELFYTLLYTGMRVSELCGLKWQDIDFTKRTIKIERQLMCQYYHGKHVYFDTPKSESGYRKIPFIGGMEAILKSQYKKVSERKLKLGKKWRNKEPEFSDLVFYSSQGTYLTKDVVARAITAVVKRINKDRASYDQFKKVHPHMFRHTFAVKCHRYGVDVKTTQTILGHASICTTMDIYTHLANDMLANEVQKIGGYMPIIGTNGRK